MADIFIAKPGFRNDINGLRAWAVVAVGFYHFDIPGFSGGFVGVDIFFVISGFLMTGIVVRGLEKNKFQIFEFYMARALRILPALIVLCTALLLRLVVAVASGLHAIGKACDCQSRLCFKYSVLE